ncbi:MAG: multiprotein-bridging factor 1 family protein [Halobacteria archaeon]
MLCELCGQPASGLKRARVGGASVLACPACLKAGAPEIAPPEPGPARLVLDAPVLKENYGETIRRAREARGWSPAQLAAEARMKEGLLRKMERNEIAPEEAVRKRLERLLKVSLLDSAE